MWNRKNNLSTAVIKIKKRNAEKNRNSSAKLPISNVMPCCIKQGVGELVLKPTRAAGTLQLLVVHFFVW